MEGQKEFVQIEQNDLFPYLLVNIGSGVSMIKVKSFYTSLSRKMKKWQMYRLNFIFS